MPTEFRFPKLTGPMVGVGGERNVVNISLSARAGVDPRFIRIAVSMCIDLQRCKDRYKYDKSR
jgi:hypothetical protein